MGKKIKSRYTPSFDYKKQVFQQINGEVMEYLDKVKHECAKRCCYAAMLALDDRFRNRFGKKDATINKNYQDFAHAFAQILADYNRDCYIWEKSEDPEAASKAMEVELKDRGIEVDFE